MTTALPQVDPSLAEHRGLVSRFVEAIHKDWHLSEAMAVKANSLLAFRGQAAGSTNSGE